MANDYDFMLSVGLDVNMKQAIAGVLKGIPDVQKVVDNNQIYLKFKPDNKSIINALKELSSYDPSEFMKSVTFSLDKKSIDSQMRVLDDIIQKRGEHAGQDISKYISMAIKSSIQEGIDVKGKDGVKRIVQSITGEYGRMTDKSIYNALKKNEESLKSAVSPQNSKDFTALMNTATQIEQNIVLWNKYKEVVKSAYTSARESAQKAVDTGKIKPTEFDAEFKKNLLNNERYDFAKSLTGAKSYEEVLTAIDSRIKNAQANLSSYYSDLGKTINSMGDIGLDKMRQGVEATLNALLGKTKSFMSELVSVMELTESHIGRSTNDIANQFGQLGEVFKQVQKNSSQSLESLQSELKEVGKEVDTIIESTPTDGKIALSSNEISKIQQFVRQAYAMKSAGMSFGSDEIKDLYSYISSEKELLKAAGLSGLNPDKVIPVDEINKRMAALHMSFINTGGSIGDFITLLQNSGQAMGQVGAAAESAEKLITEFLDQYNKFQNADFKLSKNPEDTKALDEKRQSLLSLIGLYGQLDNTALSKVASEMGFEEGKAGLNSLESEIKDIINANEELVKSTENAKQATAGTGTGVGGNLDPAKFERLIQILDQVNTAISGIAKTLGTIDEGSDIPNILTQINELKKGISPTVEEIRNLAEAVKGVDFGKISAGDTAGAESVVGILKEEAKATEEVVEAQKELKAVKAGTNGQAAEKYQKGAPQPTTPGSAKQNQFKKKVTDDDSISKNAVDAADRAKKVETSLNDYIQLYSNMITEVTEFYDSKDKLVRAQIKRVEDLNGQRTVTTTSVKYDPKEKEAFRSDIIQYKYGDKYISAEDKEALKEQISLVDEATKAYETYQKAYKEQSVLLNKGKEHEATGMFTEVIDKEAAYNEALKRLQEYDTKHNTDLVSTFEGVRKGIEEATEAIIRYNQSREEGKELDRQAAVEAREASKPKKTEPKDVLNTDNLTQSKNELKDFTDRLEKAGLLTDDVKAKLKPLQEDINKVGTNKELSDFNAKLDDLKKNSDFGKTLSIIDDVQGKKIENFFSKIKTVTNGKSESGFKDIRTFISDYGVLFNKLDEGGNVVEGLIAKNERLRESFNQIAQASMGDYTQKLDTNIQQYEQIATETANGNLQVGNLEGFVSKLNEYKAAVAEVKKYNLADIFTMGEAEREQFIKGLTEAKAKVGELGKDLDKGFQLARDTAQSNLDKKVADWLSKNTAASSEFRSQMEAIAEQLKKPLSVEQLRALGAEFNKIDAAAIRAGQTGLSFFDQWKKSASGLMRYLSTYVSFYRIIGYFRQGIEIVKQYNDALKEMKKVTTDSYNTLRQFQKESFNMGSAVGTTAIDIQKATAQWLRLGESLTEAGKSAQESAKLFNISEFDSIEKAAEGLTSVSQAYKDVSKSDIVDVIVGVGDSFPIAVNGLTEGMKRSAAALKQAGNNFQQTAALVTAGNAVVQNPESTGTALRTVALRLRGTKEGKETLEKEGEEVENYIESVSKLQSTVKNATAVASNGFKGFDILDDNGQYKSTFDILSGIATIWSEIKETDEKMGSTHAALLLETIAGESLPGDVEIHLKNIFNCKASLRALYHNNKETIL